MVCMADPADSPNPAAAKAEATAQAGQASQAKADIAKQWEEKFETTKKWVSLSRPVEDGREFWEQEAMFARSKKKRRPTRKLTWVWPDEPVFQARVEDVIFVEDWERFERAILGE
mmetsp:Transcript_46790/g.111294  ORF Transcript_46790/g.111294 Transcript_46790/m.111294 type:complete len:115 (+) Transcript_46790:104-448(+)